MRSDIGADGKRVYQLLDGNDFVLDECRAFDYDQACQIFEERFDMFDGYEIIRADPN